MNEFKTKWNFLRLNFVYRIAYQQKSFLQKKNFVFNFEEARVLKLMSKCQQSTCFRRRLRSFNQAAEISAEANDSSKLWF